MKKLFKSKSKKYKSDGDKSLVFKIVACFALFLITLAIIIITCYVVKVWLPLPIK